jgi:poly-gamma-glutamate synthesis protein (capsule biosynthesis protein)
MREATSLRFSAVGDITLGDHPMCVGFGAASRFRSEASIFPFEYVADTLRGSDVCFGNLECTHSVAGLNSGDYRSIQMRGKPSDLDGLVQAGFHVLNVANNHSLQHGKDAFLETCAGVEERGLHVCGASPTNHLVAEPAVVAVNGLTVGFVGYSLRPRQYFDYSPLYTEGLAERILSDVSFEGSNTTTEE